jgi:pyruvate formate lyase activating enzyme
MVIGGLQKLTLIDYPGKVAATVFTAGCNFFCDFCHNPDLVLVKKTGEFPFMSEEEFFWWLERKVGLLEGICITGGEPTVHNDLPDFIRGIKNLGFLVKLDTNGTSPEMLEELIKENLVDYIAMDIKAPLEKYHKFSNLQLDLEKIKRSVELVKKMPEHEFRTTLIPLFHEKKDILNIAKWITGARKYVLQQFRPDKTLDPGSAMLVPYPDKKIHDLCHMVSRHFESCEVRL